jgi:hypothetical protein
LSITARHWQCQRGDGNQDHDKALRVVAASCTLRTIGERAVTEVSECGTLVPLLRPRTRQQGVMRRDKPQRSNNGKRADGSYQMRVFWVKFCAFG